MLVRRFLGCIFVLTLLVVAGGFLFFQYGGRALTAAATPTGHFAAPPTADGPDYALPQSWLARPGMSALTDWRPTGLTARASEKRAATFYIHPTTYLDRDRWNAPLDPGGDSGFRDQLFTRSQASAFADVGEVWAPRYRQAAFGAFLLKSGDAHAALDLAYRDVLAAFDAFLAAQPKGRPIVLAGHSQGSLHLARLLKDRRAVLKGRLVAAYVVGWPLSAKADLPAMGLAACATPDQTGCVLSWQSFGDPANPKLITDAWVGTPGLGGGQREVGDMVCTNPLTGQPGEAVAPPASNPGSLVPDAAMVGASLTPGLVGAKCEGGFLKIFGAIPPLGPFVLPGNDYHVYDYALFYAAVQRDVARRLAAWR